MTIRAGAKRLGLISLVLAMAAPPAFAQQDGVFVDPDSPSGKEYAVPLDQARGEAAGGGKSAPGEEPLFGEGIKPPSGDSGKAQGSPDGGKKGGGSGEAGEPRQRDGSRQQDGSRKSVDLGASSVAIEAAAADGSDGLLSAGIAAGVLAGGLLAGFGLRRLLRSE
jgi:hypothetical protein